MDFYSDISSLQDKTRNFETLYKELEAEHNKSKSASRSLEERNKKLESELRDARWQAMAAETIHGHGDLARSGSTFAHPANETREIGRT